MMIAFPQITHLGPSTRLTGSLIVPYNQTAKLIGNFDASDATLTGLVIEDVVLNNPILQNATLSGLTEINDQLQVTGTSILNDQVWTNGSTITIDAASTVTFVGGGTLDLSQITTTLPPPTFNDVTFTGTTTVDDTLIVNAIATFNGLTTLNNQSWQSGSTIEIAGGGTVTAIGTGTLDLSAWTVVIPSPAFNNVTLNGVTTIGDVNWVNGSLIEIAAGDVISYVGGGTLDLLGVDVLLPASVYDNITLTGLTTVSDILWTNGAQLTINAGESISFVGGGTLDLLGVDILLPASVYDNVTLTGTTTIFDVQWVNGAELTIGAGEEISFIGGGALDLSGVAVTLPASVFNDLTLSGTTTISNVIWTDASTVTIAAGESVSYVGGGTLDLSTVSVILPSSIYNNVTLTGLTTIDDVQWVDGANLTINAGESISYIGGGTLDLSAVIVTLPASIYNNVTLTGVTTIDDIQWVNGANLTINAGESISFIGGGTLNLSSVLLTLPASVYNNVILTGLTTIGDVVWTDASTITIGAGESISYQGGGTLDLSAVVVTLPASIYNNVILTGLTTIGDVQWVDASTVTIAAGESISFVGGGTLDLSAVIVTLPSAVFNDVTLTGLTTIGDVTWVDGAIITIGAGESIAYVGGGTLDLSAVLVTLPASVFANVTLTGITTINNVQWVNGSSLTITLGETINYVGGGTLNLSGVLLTLPASVYDNVTLTGVTTIGDVDWQDGSAVAIGVGDSVAFVGGGTLDLSGVIVTLPASVFDNVTLTGTTTIFDVQWLDGAEITIGLGDSISYIGGGTLDLSAVLVTLPASVFNDVTLTGTTTVNSVQWVNGSNLTIAAGETINYIGGGTLNLSGVLVTLPPNITLTGTTTINNVQWVNGSNLTIAAGETINYVGGGTLNLSSVLVTLPASVYNDVTLTGTTTIGDVVWVDASTVTIGAGNSISYIGGGTIDLSGVTVVLPAPVFNNVTLTGLTTIGDVAWVDGSTIDIGAGEAIDYIGGGTLDLSGVIVVLPASVFDNVTLTGVTTIGDVVWVDGSAVTIGLGDSISYIGGGTLDLSAITVTLPASIFNNVTLTGTTTINDVDWVNGSNLTIAAGETVNYIGGGTLNLSSVLVTLPSNLTLTGTTTISSVQWVNGSNLTITSGQTISFVGGGTLDLSAVLVALPVSVFDNVTLTGTTTINDVQWVNGSAISIALGQSISYTGGGTLNLSAVLVTLPSNITLSGTTTINNVQWVNGSNLTISAGQTISFVGGGTLDLSAVLVTLPASVFNDVTLTGTTTIDDVQWVNGANLTISAGQTISFVGGGTLDLSAVLVTLPASVFNDVTLTGTTTIDDVQWVNGANLTISAGQTINYVGGGTLDLSSIIVTLPASVFNNITLTGTTIINDVQWVNGSTVSIALGQSISYIGGGTLDLSAILITLPANVTLSGTTTINNVQWVNGSNLTITSGQTINYIGGGTLNLSGVLVTLPASVFNDVTLTGTTTIDDVQWVNGANLTISAGQTISFVGGGTLDLSAVLVTLPSSVFANVTLTGTTTINDVQWVGGSNLTITSGQTITYTGGGTLDLSAVLVTLPASIFNNVTLTGLTTINDVQWVNGSDLTISTGEVINYIGGGTLNLSGVLLTLPPNVTLTGVTTIDDVQWINGANLTITSGQTISYVGGGTLDLSSVLVTLPASVFNNATFTGTTTMQGVTANYYNLNQFATNPAALLTNLWLDSTTTLRLGNGIIPKFAATSTTANVLPVVTDTSGTMSTAASATSANLFRPLVVDVGAGTGTRNVFTLQGDATGHLQLLLLNTSAGQSGTGITFGQPLVNNVSRTWSFNSALTANEFWLWKNSGTFTGNVIKVTDDGIVEGLSGYKSRRYSFTPQASSPGGSSILWADSANSNALRYDANPVIVSGAAATVVGEIPVYTSTFGTVNSSSAGATAVLNRVLTVNAGNVTLAMRSQATSATAVENNFMNQSATSNGVYVRLGRAATATIWDVGIDLANNLSNNFYIRDVVTGGASALTITGSQMVQLRDGIELQFSKYLPQAAIPANANATSIWVSSVDSTRPRWGASQQLALLTDIIAPTYNNVTLTGTTTINGTLQVNAAPTFANGIDLTPIAANPRPAGDPTLWADSTTSNALRYEANPVLVSGTAATVVGDIPVYSTTYGTMVSAFGAPGTGRINRTLVVDCNASFVPLFVQSTPIGGTLLAVFQNLSAASSAFSLHLGRYSSPVVAWRVGIDLNGNNSNNFFIRDNSAAGASALTITGSQMVQLRDGIELQFSKYLPQAAIPANADATSIWVSSVDSTRPRWGASQQLALLADITYNNLTLTGTTTINGTLQVNAPAAFSNGISPNFIEIPFSASNPAASVTNLWKDSSGVLRQGASAIPSIAMSTVANTIPVVTNTNATMTTATSTTAATLGRPLIVNAGVGSGSDVAMCTLTASVPTGRRAGLLIHNTNSGNSSASFYLGKPFVGGSSLTWEVGVDSTTNNVDNFYVRHNITGIFSMTISAADLMSVSGGVSTKRYDVLTQASNPGGATTVWASSLDNRLMYGPEAVITITTLVDVMGIQTWTGTFVIAIAGTNAPTQNVSVQLEKTRRTVSMYIPSFTYNQTATVGTGPTTITFNADVALNSMLPIDASYSSAPSTYSNTSSTFQTWKFSLANRRFEMAASTTGLVGVGASINIAFMGGVMTWMTT